MLKALTIHDLRHITALALSRDTYPGTDLPTLGSTVAELHPPGSDRALCPHVLRTG